LAANAGGESKGAAAETEAKAEPVFVTRIKDRGGDAVSEQERMRHMRKK
jgi:hypothetical protein